MTESNGPYRSVQADPDPKFLRQTIVRRILCTFGMHRVNIDVDDTKRRNALRLDFDGVDVTYCCRSAINFGNCQIEVIKYDLVLKARDMLGGAGTKNIIRKASYTEERQI